MAAISVYRMFPRDGMELAPFELCLGHSHGDCQARCAEVNEEPGAGGAMLMTQCAATAREQAYSFVTLRHLGKGRQLFLSELVVYKHPDKPYVPAPRDQIVSRMQARYDAGRPNNSPAKAGVMFHKFDNSEEDGRPWELCSHIGCEQAVDHLSVSIINRDRPNMWGFAIRDYVGIILGAHTPVLCGFAGDVGTGGAYNGACGSCNARGCTGGLRPMALWQAIEQSEGGNEIIVGSIYWDTHLPEVVDAVVFVYPEGEGEARKTHRAFLRHFGLAAAQLPLVQYVIEERRFVEITDTG